MYTGSKKLSGVGEGKNVTVTFIDPTDGYTFEESVEWNETTSLKTFSSKIEGYRFAYWTPDPPDEGGFWSNPPRESSPLMPATRASASTAGTSRCTLTTSPPWLPWSST